MNGRTHTGGHPRLHVIRAAAIQAVAIDARCVGIAHTRHTDGIGVAVEDERLATPTSFGGSDDIGAPRDDVFELDAQAGAAEGLGNIAGHGLLPSATRHQIGVDRVDGGHIMQKLNRAIHGILRYHAAINDTYLCGAKIIWASYAKNQYIGL